MTKRRIPGVELRVHHVSPRGPHSASIMIIINRRCAKNRQKGGTVCVYLHMETRPLGNYFTAGTRGVFEHSLLHSKLEYPDLPQPPKCLPVTAVDRHQGNITKSDQKGCISSASRTLEDLQPGRGQLSRWQQSGFNNKRRGRTPWRSPPNLKKTV